MTVVNTTTGEIVDMDPAAAERRAERISLRLDAIADNYRAVLPMIREAIEKRDDLALGYRSPGDYVSDRFGQALAGLGIEVRRAVVGELTEAGLSTRAIAPVVNASIGTIHNDQVFNAEHLDQTPASVDGEDPARDQEQAQPEPTAVEPAPTCGRPESVSEDRDGREDHLSGPVQPIATVTGIDGKRYTRPTPHLT